MVDNVGSSSPFRRKEVRGRRLQSAKGGGRSDGSDEALESISGINR